MKVTVAQGIQVVHKGKRFADGVLLEVSDELARRWLRAGWVSEEDCSPVARQTRSTPHRTR